jgi:hypothetical protein
MAAGAPVVIADEPASNAGRFCSPVLRTSDATEKIR